MNRIWCEVITYFRTSQMRTLSDADVYKLPDGPMHSDVMGFSPFCIRPGLDGPLQMFPEELNGIILDKVS